MKKTIQQKYPTLRLARDIMDLLVKHKEKTGVPAATFVSRLVREKLGKNQKQ
jgi:hypothetical protein